MVVETEADIQAFPEGLVVRCFGVSWSGKMS
jgi:hypothetical protein